MTRTEIIKQVSEDNRYKVFCKEIGGNLSDDLYQEIVIRFISMKTEQIEKITSVDFYFVRTAMNMVRNKYDPFFKTYKSLIHQPTNTKDPEKLEEILFEETIHEVHQREKMLAIVEDELKQIEKEYDGKYPYSVRLFRAYQNANFNFRKTQRETGILYSSCFETLKQVKKRIKKRVENDL